MGNSWVNYIMLWVMLWLYYVMFGEVFQMGDVLNELVFFF